MFELRIDSAHGELVEGPERPRDNPKDPGLNRQSNTPVTSAILKMDHTQERM